jgi:site-specific recombinase
MGEQIQVIQELLQANKDLEERLRNSPIKVAYDDEHDMLFITIGSPREAVMVEVDKRLHFRVDPETDQIIGMTITAFRKGFLSEHRDFKKHFDTVFARPRMEIWEVVPHTEASRQASSALRALVPA